MNWVPEKLLAELAQLHAAPAMAQCKRNTARWLRDFLLVWTLRHRQVKLKRLKSMAVLKLLPVPTISETQRDNLFQDRFGKDRKLLAAAAGRTEVHNWCQVSAKAACKTCTLYFFFFFFFPHRWVCLALCGIQKQVVSFSFQWKGFPLGKVRQLCRLSRWLRAEPQA